MRVLREVRKILMETLKEAQDYIAENSEVGVSCPCCGRFVKLYKRKIHTEMAVFLVKLYKAALAGGKHKAYSTRELINTETKASTDGAYLTRWGLITKASEEATASGNVGRYRITSKGLNFVSGIIQVPKRVHILCGETIGFSAEMVFIWDCLGDKFDYDEIMRVPPGQ